MANYTNFNQLTARIHESCQLSPPSEDTNSVLFQDWIKSAGESISKHTRQVHIRKGIIEIVVDSPTWAHQIINQQNTLVQRMRDRGHSGISELSVRVKIVKKFKQPQHILVKPQQRKFSKNSGKIFSELAANSSNPKIKEIFLRLSKKAQSK